MQRAGSLTNILLLSIECSYGPEQMWLKSVQGSTVGLRHDGLSVGVSPALGLGSFCSRPWQMGKPGSDIVAVSKHATMSHHLERTQAGIIGGLKVAGSRRMHCIGHITGKLQNSAQVVQLTVLNRIVATVLMNSLTATRRIRQKEPAQGS